MFSSPQRASEKHRGNVGMKNINTNSVSSVNSVVKIFGHRAEGSHPRTTFLFSKF